MDDVKFAYPQLLDSVSDETSSAEFISLKGASQVSEISYAPLSGSGSATLVFSILPPSTSTIIDSTLLLEMDVTIVVSSITGDANATLGFISLNSWPLQKAIQNLSISVNGLNLSHTPYRFQSLYERLEVDDDFRKTYYSLFPSRLDETTDQSGYSYNDMLLNGSRAGPFADNRWDGDRHLGPSRFEFGPRVDDIATDIRKLTRTYRVCEPLCLGGLFRSAYAHGITNVNKLDITIQWADMVQFSVCNPKKIGNAVNTNNTFQPGGPLVSANAQAYPAGGASGAAADTTAVNDATLSVQRSGETLRLRYMTASASIPSVVKLPYSQILPYANTFNAQTFDAPQNALSPTTKKFTVQSIKSSMVPSFIYIVARPVLLKKTAFDMDLLLPITNLNLTMGNQVGIMSGASPSQLYQISCRNGYALSFTDWKKQCVICLQVGQDLPGVPGAIGQFSLQADVSVSYYGVGANLVCDLEIDIFLSNDGQIEISRDMASLRMGINTSAIAEKITEEPEDNPDNEGAGYGRRHGGSFKSFFRKVGRFLKPIGKAVLPMAEKVLTGVATKALTGMMGAGEGGARMMGGNALGGARMLGGADERRAMRASKLLS